LAAQLSIIPLEDPWLARPLPWASWPRPWWVDRLLVPLFVLELVLLWWMRRGRLSVVLGALVLLVGVGMSAYQLWIDAELNDPEQYYALADWQGVLFLVAGAAGCTIGFTFLLAAIAHRNRRWLIAPQPPPQKRPIPLDNRSIAGTS
jgi:hypothetical protein